MLLAALLMGLQSPGIFLAVVISCADEPSASKPHQQQQSLRSVPGLPLLTPYHSAPTEPRPLVPAV
jgi:hypothetical protein